MVNSEDVEERRKAVEQLLDNFASFSDKYTAWSDLRRLTQDEDKEIQLIAAYVLGHVFSEIPDKDAAWSDLIRLTQDENEDVRLIVMSRLAHVFSEIPDKDAAWLDLIRLTQDENEDVRLVVTDVLAHAFSHIPNKDAAWSDLIRLIQDENKKTEFIAASVIDRIFSEIPDKNIAWSDLIRLTQDENKDTRFIAAYTLGPVFSYIPNNNAAWSDLHRLTQDEKEEARWGAANALGYSFSHITNKDTAWSDLHRLTQDGDKKVRMQAYHSLGSASVYKATETEDEEKFRDELKKAIDYFESSSRESIDGFYNPARFCLPFYRSYYAVISSQEDVEAEATKYLDEAKNAVDGSESREALLEAVKYLANALEEAQKPLDFGETKDHLRACKQYCDNTAQLMDNTRKKAPMAAAAIMRGIPIVGVKVKEIIEEIQEKAKEACQQAKGTPTEEIACAINQEVQKWRIDDQKEMTQKVDNLVFCLKSKISDNPQNKHIHEEIDKIREESNMTKQYEMVSLLIALIPTASVHTGDVINADVTASGESQVVVKGNENKNASDNAPASKKSLIKWINSPATIAAFVGFMCAEIGTYFYPITYNHLISVGIAGLAFIIVAIFNKE